MKRFLRGVLFALVPTAATLGVLELACAALGWGSEATRAFSAHGFDREASYFVPWDDPPGSARTQMFRGGEGEKVVPPKGDTFRIFLFGGSNTQGFPAVRLERVLELIDPSRDYEVVNLGREGYGSGRVAILLEQSLAYEPDLCVVYSGHNEFIEAGFRQDVEAARDDLAGRLQPVLAELRSFRALERVATGQVSSGTEEGKSEERPPPEDWVGEYEKFAEQTYAETLARLELYRENLTAMDRACREAGVRILFSTIVTNHFDRPYASTPDAEIAQDVAREVDELVASARERCPDTWALLDPLEPSLRLQARDWKRREETDENEHLALLRLRPLTGRLDQPEPWWPEPRYWSPQVVDVVEAFAAFLGSPPDEVERADLERAADELDRALELIPEHPHALFLRGLVAHRLGETERAARLLRDAQRFDRAPRKASDLTNDIVREVAAGSDHVELYDADREWAERVPDGLFGYEILGDNCHLHPRTAWLLMRDFAEAILRQ